MDEGNNAGIIVECKSSKMLNGEKHISTASDDEHKEHQRHKLLPL